MNYKELLIDILRKRGIEDIGLYQCPTPQDNINPFDFHGMKKGVDLLRKHITNKSRIVVVSDCDADGQTSASIIYQYLKQFDCDMTVLFHLAKAHGLSEDIDINVLKTVDLVILPDAGTNDREQVANLNSNGIDVLIIDHHDILKDKVVEENEQTVLINNQSTKNINTDRELTGAGMCYKFIEALGDYENMNKILAYASLGQIGDVSDYSKNGIRWLVFEGIKHMDEIPLVMESAKEIVKYKKSITPIDLGFGIIPLINAVCRMGTQEDKIMLFNALNDIDMSGNETIETTKLNKRTRKRERVTKTISKYEKVISDLQKIKARQNNHAKKVSKNLDIIENGGIVIGIKKAKEENCSTTGLVAQQLVTKYDKPALVLEERDGQLTGSARSNSKYIDDFRKWCENTRSVNYAEGHSHSFGISIDPSKLNEFKSCSKTIKEQGRGIEIDAVVQPEEELVDFMDRHRGMFGGVIKKPIFKFENVKISAFNITISKNGYLQLNYGGVKFVKFGVKEEEYYNIIQQLENGYGSFDIVGETNVSCWLGKKIRQVIISSYTIKPIEDEWNNFDF